MPDPALSLSDLIGESLVDDALFAAAYGESSDRERALMKTCIARLYDWYGPSRETACEVARRWRGGFASVARSESVDFCVILFDGTFVSPARLLAALVPAVACGVRDILAVRVDGQGEWARPLLTAMELAGQELVADLTGEGVSDLLDTLGEAGASGVVIDLAGLDVPDTGRSRLALYRPVFDGSAAIYLNGPETFDLEALAFSYPDTVFTAFGADVPLPDGFARGGEDFSALLEGTHDAAFVPADRIGDALDRIRLVLGPGQEGCWVWPELHPGLFLYHRIAWTIGD
jgi:hypothetical protein